MYLKYVELYLNSVFEIISGFTWLYFKILSNQLKKRTLAVQAVWGHHENSFGFFDHLAMHK